jgi:hypothetical protein
MKKALLNENPIIKFIRNRGVAAVKYAMTWPVSMAVFRGPFPLGDDVKKKIEDYLKKEQLI